MDAMGQNPFQIKEIESTKTPAFIIKRQFKIEGKETSLSLLQITFVLRVDIKVFNSFIKFTLSNSFDCLFIKIEM